jgi:large subunit ribosomal protein L28
MASKCEVCGKGTTFGRNIRYQHAGKWERRAPRTNRVFRANVQTKSLTINGETRRFHICTRCLRNQVKVAR